jgi:hypothetical protein
MQQIADWLKTLGMSEYAECFAANDIEFDILPELTDHDLERLGVSLGSSPAYPASNPGAWRSYDSCASNRSGGVA